MSSGREASGELPRWVVVPLVQVSGVAGVLAGFWMLSQKNWLGLSSILAGQKMALRPRRQLKLRQLLDLLSNRRAGPENPPEPPSIEPPDGTVSA